MKNPIRVRGVPEFCPGPPSSFSLFCSRLSISFQLDVRKLRNYTNREDSRACASSTNSRARAKADRNPCVKGGAELSAPVRSARAVNCSCRSSSSVAEDLFTSCSGVVGAGERSVPLAFLDEFGPLDLLLTLFCPTLLQGLRRFLQTFALVGHFSILSEWSNIRQVQTITDFRKKASRAVELARHRDCRAERDGGRL